MAKKGQKFNKYSEKFRKIVIKEVLMHGKTSAARLYKVNYRTVSSWYCNYKKGILNKKQGSKGSKDLECYKMRYELLKKLHDFYNYQAKIK